MINHTESKGVGFCFFVCFVCFFLGGGVVLFWVGFVFWGFFFGLVGFLCVFFCCFVFCFLFFVFLFF